jgi:WD40 repeat protein
VEGHFVQVLSDSVPVLSDDEKGVVRDWRLAHPYVRAYLAKHAAKAAELTGLIDDPLFLLSADPKILSQLLVKVSSVPSSMLRMHQSMAEHFGKPIREAVSYLELAARQNHIDYYADRIASLPVARSWRVPWVIWRFAANGENRRRGFLDSNSVAISSDNGQTTVVSRSTGGEVGLWNLNSGTKERTFLTRQAGLLSTMTTDDHTGRVVAVSYGDDEAISAFCMDRGEFSEHVVAHRAPGITALAIGQVASKTVIVAGSQDGNIKMWDFALEGVDLRCEILESVRMRHNQQVGAIVISELWNRPVAIAGTWYGTISIWSIDDGTLLKEFSTFTTRRGQSITALTVTTANAGSNILISGSAEGSIRFWDLEKGIETYKPVIGHKDIVKSIEMASIDGRSFIITGSFDRTVALWRLGSGLIQSINVGAPVYSVKFNRPSTLLAGTSMGLVPIVLDSTFAAASV